jgi:hypothetical protein
MPALSSRGEFVTRVPVMPGTSSVVATLADPSGTVLSRHEVPVTATASGPAPLDVEVWPPGGGTPLEVTLRVPSLAATSEAAFDLDGDGSLDTPFSRLDAVDHTYTSPGIYVPIAHVRDSTGNIRRGTTFVWIADPVTLDARLQSVWTGLKDALRAGDVSRALGFMHSRTRDAYRDNWTGLDPAMLAQIDTVMTSIRLVEVGLGGAEYEMLRPRGADIMSFSVWFELDADGVWRLRRF